MRKPIVAYQGIAEAFSERAAYIFFGKNALTPVGYETFEDVFNALKNNTADYACIPVENSTAGSVDSNYHLFKDFNGTIEQEVYLRISLTLLGIPGSTLKNIQRAHAHPVALKQCMAFLKNHTIKPVVAFDNAGAAHIVSQKKDPTVAAIAGISAGEKYGLVPLAKHIESEKNNYTRFLLLSNKKQLQKGNKLSLLYSVKHKPGTLMQSLLPFAKRGINLTKIEEIPITSHPWEYYFFSDYQINDVKETQKALDSMKKHCEWVTILGWYAQGKIYES